MVAVTPRLFACATLAALVSAGLGVAARERLLAAVFRDVVLAPGSPVRGLRIAGRTLAPGESSRDLLVRQARAIESERVRLAVPGGGRALDTTLGALGVRVDVEDVAARAAAVGHHGSLAVRITERLHAARGEIDVPLEVTLDRERAIPPLVALKEETDERPVPARYDFDSKKIVPHRAGAALDLDATLATLRSVALASGATVAAGRDPRTVEASRAPVLPPITAESLRLFDPRETISRYETSFAWLGKEAPRAHNIATAAAHLDGAILGPSEVVSFNALVGPRTTDNGFERAFQIYKGEMIEGVGGGTCQVSSTLHAAALYGGLEIVERAPHSRPLGYVPLGLDSTVVYPEVDLKVRNPWPFPVAIHTHVEHGTIRVELVGERRVAPVTLARETLHVEPFTRKVEVHPELRAGRYLLKQKGIRGYDIRIMRRTTAPDGTSRVETRRDRYPETPELYWVAPGLDAAHALPPIAEGGVLRDEAAAEGSSPGI